MAAGLIERVASFFRADARGAVAVYVYGSAGRGENTPSSDVDVAVLFDVPPASRLTGPALTLESDLERLLRKPVDLVVLNSASADLVHRVLRDGVIVLDADRSRRLRFEVAKRNEYFDLEPVRREYRAARARHAATRP
jgi:predicted nucleotidyltransferase